MEIIIFAIIFFVAVNALPKLFKQNSHQPLVESQRGATRSVAFNNSSTFRSTLSPEFRSAGYNKVAPIKRDFGTARKTSNYTRKPYTPAKKAQPSSGQTKQFSKFDWESAFPQLKFKIIWTDDLCKQINNNLMGVQSGENVTSNTPQGKYVPYIKARLNKVSIDETTYQWKKMFAKPDAIFSNRNKDQYIVAEYKSRYFNNDIKTIAPINVFQLLASALVFQKNLQRREIVNAQGETEVIKQRILPVLRFNNAVVEIRGWAALVPMISRMAETALATKSFETISATELARVICLMNPNIPYTGNGQKDAQIRGNILHELMACKDEKPNTTDEKNGGQ